MVVADGERLREAEALRTELKAELKAELMTEFMTELAATKAEVVQLKAKLAEVVTADPGTGADSSPEADERAAAGVGPASSAGGSEQAIEMDEVLLRTPVVEENTYCHEIKDGKPHGEGELNAAGEREGVGVMVYANGGMYEGQWVADKREGEGTYHFAEGNRYVGQFVAGNMEGKGTMHFANSNRYEGEWVANQKEGVGTLHYASGNRYEGEWVADRPEGEGTYHSANGDRYEGEFVAGKKEGEGTYHFANGNRYVGQYAADKREGVGTFHYAGGDVEVGRYEGGADVGQAVGWSSGRATAWRLSYGAVTGPVPLEVAARIAEQVGLPVPGAVDTKSKRVPGSHETTKVSFEP